MWSLITRGVQSLTHPLSTHVSPSPTPPSPMFRDGDAAAEGTGEDDLPSIDLATLQAWLVPLLLIIFLFGCLVV